MPRHEAITRRAAALHLVWPALAALGAHPLARAAAAYDFGHAIDAAGRQRMLSQRIVKAYCKLGLGVTPALSRQQLAEAARRFDAQLAMLSREAPNGGVRQALQREAALWAPVRRASAGAVTRAGARQLAQRSEELLLAAHDVVLRLESAAGTPQARLVNLAGRQRMLSQRLAKLYMLRAWGVAGADARAQIDDAAAEFTRALTTLRAAPENTPAIAAELEAVDMQWGWFSTAIGQQGAQSYALVVAEASEAILNSMDLVTGLYAALR